MPLGTILIVEDDEPIRVGVVDALELDGHVRLRLGVEHRLGIGVGQRGAAGVHGGGGGHATSNSPRDRMSATRHRNELAATPSTIRYFEMSPRT